MKPVLTQVRCSVRECGAMVLVADVEGRKMILNPTWVDVVVADAAGRLTLTRGLMPHGATCVDISTRSSYRAAQAEG